jgi:uncharacterized protein
MEIDPEKIEVIHNEVENRFEVWAGEYLSKLDYMLNGDTITMTHVGVPPELRNHGLAARITQVALEYAKGRSLRVIPMCSYVAAYIRRNPQYAALTKQKQMHE